MNCKDELLITWLQGVEPHGRNMSPPVLVRAHTFHRQLVRPTVTLGMFCLVAIFGPQMSQDVPSYQVPGMPELR